VSSRTQHVSVDVDAGDPLDELEYGAEAVGGMTPGGDLWWGSRVRFRRRGTRRWSSFVLVGVHPLQYVSIAEGLRVYLASRGG